jgi:hypothetical protein
MAAKRAPVGLGVGGRALWRAITDAHDLDVMQGITLLEACRAKDRLDKLDGLIRGEAATWATLTDEALPADFELRIEGAPALANATATLLKQLLASLRLPDPSTGRRPQRRGGARGVYAGHGYWDPA